jgi:hypothetical protein
MISKGGKRKKGLYPADAGSAAGLSVTLKTSVRDA